jgi:hypothetical protein
VVTASGHISGRLREELACARLHIGDHELGESRQLAAEYPDVRDREAPFGRPVVTTRGHVKGRGLARKSSAHCVVFSEREKAPKA